ncbi:MAG: hypothetical protein K2I79_00520, partial [Clostridia bacterium]|nr:hypothetical protein [Clostridia bacterium]
IAALNDEDAEKLYSMIKVEYNGSAVNGVREGGVYTVTLSKEETGNYEALYETGMTFEILKEDMTVTINGNETFEKFYNENMIPNVVISVVGNTSGVDVSSTQSALLSISFRDESGRVVSSAKDVGTYTMTVSYPGTVNRNSAMASISIIVKPKQLTLSLADTDGNDITSSHAETRIYNKAAYTPDYVLNGVVRGETVLPTFTYKDENGNVMSSAPINANSYVNDTYGSYSVNISLPASYKNYTLDSYDYSLTIQKFMLEVDYLTRTSYALRSNGNFSHGDYLGWMTEAICMYDADGTLFDADALNAIRQASTDDGGVYNGFIFNIFTDSKHSSPITDIVNQFNEYNGSLHMHILLNEAVLALEMFAGGNYGVVEDIDYIGHTTGIDITIVKFAVGVTVDNALASGSVYRMFGTEYGLALQIYTVVGVDGQTYGASVTASTGRITHELAEYTARDIISNMSVTITNVSTGLVHYESGTQAPGSAFFTSFFNKNDGIINGISADNKPLHAGTYEVSYRMTIDSYPDNSGAFSTWTLQTSARIVIMPVQLTVGGGLSDIKIAYHHAVTEELLASSNENSVSHEGLNIVYASDVLGTKPNVGEYEYTASLAVADGYEGQVYLSDYVLDDSVGKINVEILEVNVSVKDLAFTYGDDYKIL